MKYSKTLIRLGELKKSLEILNKIIIISKKVNKKDIFLDRKILKMGCLKRLSDFSYIKEAEFLLNKIKNEEKQNHIKCLVAEALMRTGNLDKSFKLFNEIIKKKNLALKEDVASAYVFILIILTIQRKIKEAFSIYKEALQFAEIIRLKIAYAGDLY